MATFISIFGAKVEKQKFSTSGLFILTLVVSTLIFGEISPLFEVLSLIGRTEIEATVVEVEMSSKKSCFYKHQPKETCSNYYRTTYEFLNQGVTRIGTTTSVLEYPLDQPVIIEYPTLFPQLSRIKDAKYSVGHDKTVVQHLFFYVILVPSAILWLVILGLNQKQAK